MPQKLVLDLLMIASLKDCHCSCTLNPLKLRLTDELGLVLTVSLLFISGNEE